MKKLALGLIFSGAMFASVANADTIEEATGNTVVVELADGTVERDVGEMLRSASDECRELLVDQCVFRRTMGDGVDCPKLIDECEEKVWAREREARVPAATPKTPETTAEPNAAGAKEDTDTNSGAEEAQSSDEVADPELDGDAAVEEEADSEEQSDDGEAENEEAADTDEGDE